jgi:DNA-binding MarR family transcriptional regulator
MPQPTIEPVPDLACACATLRRAARAVTHLYADELQGLLEGTQYALLAVLNSWPGQNQATLGRILVLDKTTLSRNLALMKRRGWIEPAATGDRRERGFHLTSAGARLLKSARPAWERAQRRLLMALGETGWRALFSVANSVTGKATTALASAPAPKKRVAARA